MAAALAAFPLIASAETYPFHAGTVVGGVVTGNTVTVGVYTGGGAMNNMGMATPTGSTMTVPPGWATATGSDGKPEFRTTGKGPVPGVPSKQVPVDIVAKPTAASVGKALARFAWKALPIVNTALALKALLNELNVTATEDGYSRSNPAAATLYFFNATTYCADGPVGAPRYCYNYSTTPQGMCAQWETLSIQEYGPGNTVTYVGPSAPTLTPGYCARSAPRGGTAQVIVKSAGDPNAAPIPMTEQELADKITQAVEAGNPKIIPALNEAINHPQFPQSVEVGKPKVTGPSSVPGPTTTTTETTPTGQTTKNTTSTIGVTYNQNQYTTNITNNTTTNTTNNTNNTTTTTTTTQTQETPPETDLCKTNPEISACAKMGDPPEPDELDKQDHDVTIEPKNFAGGSCPSPVAFSVFGRSYSFSYSPLCQRLAQLAPLFMALAAFIAAWILSDSFKVSG